MTEPVEHHEARPSETYERRAVTRLIDRRQHIPGANVANFLGDAQTMIETGHLFGLDERSLRFLRFAVKFCVIPANNSERAEDSMTGPQWGRFVGIRRPYLSHQHSPAQLCAILKSKFRTTSTHTAEH